MVTLDSWAFGLGYAPSLRTPSLRIHFESPFRSNLRPPGSAFWVTLRSVVLCIPSVTPVLQADCGTLPMLAKFYHPIIPCHYQLSHLPSYWFVHLIHLRCLLFILALARLNTSSKSIKVASALPAAMDLIVGRDIIKRKWIVSQNGKQTILSSGKQLPPHLPTI